VYKDMKLLHGGRLLPLALRLAGSSLLILLLLGVFTPAFGRTDCRQALRRYVRVQLAHDREQAREAARSATEQSRSEIERAFAALKSRLLGEKATMLQRCHAQRAKIDLTCIHRAVKVEDFHHCRGFTMLLPHNDRAGCEEAFKNLERLRVLASDCPTCARDESGGDAQRKDGWQAGAPDRTQWMKECTGSGGWRLACMRAAQNLRTFRQCRIPAQYQIDEVSCSQAILRVINLGELAARTMLDRLIEQTPEEGREALAAASRKRLENWRRLFFGAEPDLTELCERNKQVMDLACIRQAERVGELRGCSGYGLLDERMMEILEEEKNREGSVVREAMAQSELARTRLQEIRNAQLSYADDPLTGSGRFAVSLEALGWVLDNSTTKEGQPCFWRFSTNGKKAVAFSDNPFQCRWRRIELDLTDGSFRNER
jgi:hypothetical protein